MKSRRALILSAVAAVVAISGAAVIYWQGSGKRKIEAAPHAGNPACEKVVSKLPSDLLGGSREDTDPAGTAAWGSRSIVLRCGVEPPLPTPDQCVSVNGVDWVIDEARLDEDGVRSVTTYGRSPAVEVTFFDESQSVGDALVDLTGSVEHIRQKSPCIE